MGTRSDGTARLQVYFDRTCRLCGRAASLIQHLDRGRRCQVVGVVPGEPPESPQGESVGALLAHTMVVITPDGRLLARGSAVRAVVERLSPVSWLRHVWSVPGAGREIDRLYDLVARNRHRLGCSGDACVDAGGPDPA